EMQKLRARTATGDKDKVKVKDEGKPPSGGGTAPTVGGSGAAPTVVQLLRNELQELQFYLEATKLPATVLGRDLDVLGQTFNELTEDIKKNGLTLDDIAKLYSLSTEKAELLRRKQ